MHKRSLSVENLVGKKEMLVKCTFSFSNTVFKMLLPLGQKPQECLGKSENLGQKLRYETLNISMIIPRRHLNEYSTKLWQLKRAKT